MSESINGFEHKVEISGRNRFNVSGVSGVVSFDDSQLCVTLCTGEYLYIEGNSIDISEVNLQNGILIADGKVTGLFYEESNAVVKSKGFLKGFFKKS